MIKPTLLHEQECREAAGKEGSYHTRCWRTKVLREAAGLEVAKLISAFVPDGFTIQIRHDVLVCGGEGPDKDRVWPVVATLGQFNADGSGSDAHFFAAAETTPGVLCKLLAIVLDGRGFYPLT